MRPYSYVRAQDVDGAVATLAEAPNAEFLAGGTNLVDLMKLGVVQPDVLVDVRRLTSDRVEDLDAERREGRFDAVFVAVGAHLSTRVDIPNQDASRVLDAVTFLRDASAGGGAAMTGRVAVYGGGNTAMDAARVARRLGAEDTVIVYRRTREQMPAHESEAQDAEEEGIRISWLRTISSMGEGELTVEVQELDEHGRPHGTGRFETLAADTVILAVGQESDTGFLRGIPGIEVLEFDGGHVRFTAPSEADADRVLREAIERGSVRSFSPAIRPLTEIFQEVVR